MSSLRLAAIGRIGTLSLVTLLGCSSSDPPAPGGTGGTPSGGSPSGGMSTGGGGASAGGETGGGGSGIGGDSGGSNAVGGGGSSAGGETSGGSGGATGGSGGGGGGDGGKSKTTFFVTSDKATTGDLGGLTGADERCQALADAAGITGHTFKAYLSTSTVNAGTRIGQGPWYNANGDLIAENLAALHNGAMLKGNADLFITEKKEKINGQWDPSLTPNEHDILTGTLADGTVSADAHCQNWTSDSADDNRQVGHSDGFGPNMQTTNGRDSWVAAHVVNGCNTTAPGGGAGRIYCFADGT